MHQLTRLFLDGLHQVLTERIARQQPTGSSIYLLADFRYHPLIGNINRWPQNVEIENEFLKKGITLAVDGTEPATIKAVLQAEMTYIKKRHEDGMQLLNYITDMAPAYGMIGTLVGLVNMLANLSDPSAIGPAMAVAILTTLYGALVANVVTLQGEAALQTQWEKLGGTLSRIAVSRAEARPPPR